MALDCQPQRANLCEHHEEDGGCPQGADVRVFHDRERLRGRLAGADRVTHVSQAVQMEAAAERCR